MTLIFSRGDIKLGTNACAGSKYKYRLLILPQSNV